MPQQEKPDGKGRKASDLRFMAPSDLPPPTPLYLDISSSSGNASRVASSSATLVELAKSTAPTFPTLPTKSEDSALDPSGTKKSEFARRRKLWIVLGLLGFILIVVAVSVPLVLKNRAGSGSDSLSGSDGTATNLIPPIQKRRRLIIFGASYCGALVLFLRLGEAWKLLGER